MRPILALLVAGIALLPAPVAAQSALGIAAVVNDEVISVHDFRQRIRMVLFVSGIRDTVEARRRAVRQTLRALIDERLQLQEAGRLGVNVSERELDLSVADLERRNRMQPGSLATAFERNRVSLASLRAQLRARLAWTKLVRRRLLPRIKVGDGEVKEVLAQLEATAGEDAYRLGEIFLAVTRPDDEPAVRESAARIVEQVRDGARFGALARQFSQSATAASDGDTGWTARSELDPELAAAIDRLAPGEVLDPIRTISGYQIYSLLGKRRNANVDPDEIQLHLKQILVPLGDGGDAARIERVRDEANAINGCEDLVAVAERLGARTPQDLGTVKRADLSAEIGRRIANVAVGRASAPIKVPGGAMVVVVCGRILPELDLPDEKMIMGRLLDQRVDLAAQRYLRDLRSAAIIDIRI